MSRFAFMIIAGFAALPLAAALGAAPARPHAPAAFARCASCHAAEPGAPAEIGPNLWGVAGTRAGRRPGFAYSAALKRTGLTWNRATLSRWLANGQAVAPGTTMPNQNLKPTERKAIVTYLLALK